jgi:hypothetical protein
LTNQRQPESKGLSNAAMKAMWHVGPPSPEALGQPDEPPAEPTAVPDYGGGPRGKNADKEPSMDELLRAAARGHVDR